MSSTLTGLTEMTSPVVAGDWLPMVDASDNTTSPHGTSGSSKKIQMGNLAPFLAQQADGSVYLTPSGSTGGSADAALIEAVRSAAAGARLTVKLSKSLPWYIAGGTIGAFTTGQYVDAPGCFIWATGSGDVFRFTDSSNYNSRGEHGGGVLGNPVMDGTNTTGAASAVHIGDIAHCAVEVSPQNFTQAGSDGVIFDNTVYWTERITARISTFNCYRGVRFTQNPASGTTTATGSFMRSDLRLYVEQGNAAYDGIVFENGAYCPGSFLRWWGNFNGASSGGALSSAAIKITGITPSGSADSSIPSNLYKCMVEWDFECGANTFTPYSIYIDQASGCSIANLLGVANFANGGYNFQQSVGSVGFFGLSDYLPVQTSQAMLFEGVTAVGNWAGPASLASNGTISTSASWAEVAPTATVTGAILASGAYDGQVCKVLNASAFPVTFAAPATSHVNGGAGDIIPAFSIQAYLWSNTAQIWIREDAGAPFTVRLASSFTSGTGTAQQNVTGLAAYLGVGTWKVRGWFPYVGAGTVGSTQKFALVFGGTASGSAGYVAWQNHAAAYSAPTVGAAVTTAVTTATITSTVYYMEFTGTVVVSAAGVLQLTVQSTTSGDEILIEAGAFLEATQVA